MSQRERYEWGRVVSLGWNEPLNARWIIIPDVYDKDFKNKWKVLELLLL